MRLISTEAYYEQLLQKTATAKRRIVLAAMLVLADAKTSPVFDRLEAALRRGVAVHVMVDVYFRSLLETGNGRRLQRQIIAETERRLARLVELGGVVKFYGQLGLNPFKGRSHIKVTVVDDTIYSFGGINFYGGSFGHADYMLTADDPVLADRLIALVKAAPSTHDDQQLPISPVHIALFDGGQPGASVIYDKACRLAAQASRIYYVSQMAPSGRLVKAMRAADCSCYFNRVSNPDSGLFISLSLIIDQTLGRVKNLYHRQQYIHAKFMLFELRDGSRALLSGSNNFSWRGIAYGTQEIALYSTDERLWQQLYEFLQQQIK